MTTTARRAAGRIAATTRPLADLAVSGFDTCDLCPLAAAYLYARTDDRDGSEVRVCEHCADHAAVSYRD